MATELPKLSAEDMERLRTQLLLQQMQQGEQEDEISLLDLWRVIYSNRRIIYLITTIAVVVALAIAVLTTPIYSASTLLAPAGEEKQGGGAAAALASQFGGLASMAGISIPGGGDIETTLAILNSRTFLLRFINDNNLKPILFDKAWSAEKQQWMDSEPGLLQQGIAAIKSILLPAEPKQLTSSVGDEQLQPGEPTGWDAYEAFSPLLSASADKKTSLVTLSINYKDPYLAAKWANMLVQQLNQDLRQKAIDDAERSIEYLQQQVQQTRIADLQTVLYRLIEDHTKNITLAKTNQEYALKVIDKAVAPQKRSKPKRGLIVVLGFILGIMLGVFVAFIRNAIANIRKENQLESN